MNERAAARRYAVTLQHACAGEQDALLRCLEAAAALLQGSPEFAAVLAHPTVSLEDKWSALQQALPSPLPAAAVDLIRGVIEHRLARFIPSIARELRAVHDEEQGIAVVDVQSARPLTADEENALSVRAAALTGKKMRMRYSVEPDLVAGLVVRIGTLVVDNALASDMARLRAELTAVSRG
jgi:F-type H+-transporting ATPase subunit delta